MSGHKYVAEAEEDGPAAVSTPLVNAARQASPPSASNRLGGIWLLWQFIKQTWVGVKRARVNYCLGFTACFVVVFVVALLVSVLAKSPVIYLRLGELNNGEVDVLLSAGTFTGFARFNYTLVSDLLKQGNDASDYQYHSPRIRMGLYVFASNSCSVSSDPWIPDWKYAPNARLNNSNCDKRPLACMWDQCPHRHAASADAFIIDNPKEKAMSYGRGWSLPADLGSGEVYLSEYLAKSLKVELNQTIYIIFNISDLVDRGMLVSVAGGASNSSDWATTLKIRESVIAPFRIKALFADPQGKFPIHIEDGLILEYKTLLSHLALHSNPYMWGSAENRSIISEKLSLFHFASEIAVNFPPPRLEQYMSSNYDSIQSHVVRFADSLLFKIGFTNVFVDMPILRQLRDTRFFSLFLGLILNVIIFILLFLSIVLIYSLLMISVETRTFELGILRMIGTTRRGIVMLVMTQAFFYAVPALVAGLLVAQFANIGVSLKIKELTGADVGDNLDPAGVAWALFLGLATPVLSAILPIRSALGMNLQDSLDTKHSKTKAVDIKVERAESGQSLSVELLSIGVGLSLFGGAIYYVFPLALLTFNLGLLMNIFVFLLLGMLLGLVVLALNVEHVLEKAVVFSFLLWESPAIRSIVLKNLVAHRPRNRKTTIMYALALGFIIFVNVAYNIEVATFQSFQLQRHGAYFVVEGGWVDPQNKRIFSIRDSRVYLEASMTNLMSGSRPLVIDYAWSTYEWRDAIFEAKEVSMSNLGRLKSSTQHLYGVSPNFFETALNDPFLLVGSTTYQGPDEKIAEALYSYQGSSQALVGSLYKEYNGLDFDSQMLLTFRSAQPNRPDTELITRRRLKPLAFLDSSPRFTMSAFPQYSSQDMLVSILSFLRMSNGTYTSIDDIPYKYFIVKLRDDITEAEIEQVSSSLRAAASADPGIGIWDFRRTQRPFQVASMAMNYIFSFTTIIAMAISFFSLMSSMFTNIYEQTKEIGILRALGVDKSWMYRIYIYEAFVLVFVASLIGIVIGLLVGYTMTIQQALFTSFPLPFIFPWQVLLTVLACSVLFSLLSSFSPVRNVVNRRVVQIFRMVS